MKSGLAGPAPQICNPHAGFNTGPPGLLLNQRGYCFDIQSQGLFITFHHITVIALHTISPIRVDNVGTNELTDYDQGQFWQEKTALDFVEREGIEEVFLLKREELVRDVEELTPSQYPLIKLLKEKRDTLDLLSID